MYGSISTFNNMSLHAELCRDDNKLQRNTLNKTINIFPLAKFAFTVYRLIWKLETKPTKQTETQHIATLFPLPQRLSVNFCYLITFPALAVVNQKLFKRKKEDISKMGHGITSFLQWNGRESNAAPTDESPTSNHHILMVQGNSSKSNSAFH